MNKQTNRRLVEEDIKAAAVINLLNVVLDEKSIHQYLRLRGKTIPAFTFTGASWANQLTILSCLSFQEKKKLKGK